MTSRSENPKPTSMTDIRDLAAIRLYSVTEPNYAGLMGLGKFAAYKEAREGRVPTIRVGRRGYRVPVAALRRQLGDLPDEA